ncbi:hypothetical protein [Fodinibius halophilus]|uniref:Uncharacterized protein n=1 Tax=Fodinibius halophilus TaxID=1736908 RepID=A0A6M1TD15_9BACT|nr:hypothetical protein [Fodinibius halophilus]NGP90293.1 hypothetical protein [Fodinibius halophilus]
MIPEEKLEPYVETIRKAVIELYNYLEEECNSTSDLILFLENGHKANMPLPDHLPYVIGPGEEYHNDKYRVEFYLQYLNSGGKEKHRKLAEQGEIKDLERFQRFSLFLELMIYSHLWENKKNLRELRQIARLLNENSYDWELEVPDYGKSQFIDEDIKQVFLNHDLAVGELFDEIYISQVRNAFAHSEFSFMPNGEAILLGNYDGTEFKNLKRIEIDHWEDIFLKSTIFFHEFLVMKEKKRVELGGKNPTIEIEMPSEDGEEIRKLDIHWHEEGQAYSFNKPAS